MASPPFRPSAQNPGPAAFRPFACLRLRLPGAPTPSTSRRPNPPGAFGSPAPLPPGPLPPGAFDPLAPQPCWCLRPSRHPNLSGILFRRPNSSGTFDSPAPLPPGPFLFSLFFLSAFCPSALFSARRKHVTVRNLKLLSRILPEWLQRPCFRVYALCFLHEKRTVNLKSTVLFLQVFNF